MRVLDLFCGLKGWSQAFEDRGHEVVTVDIDKKFEPTLTADIMDLDWNDLATERSYFDIVLASPPCNCFSVASIGRYWNNTKPYEAIDLIAHTVRLIIRLSPRWWILENPRGMMRRILGKPSITTYFASWGDFALKPTDLWGVLPEVKWNRPSRWQRAPRGSRKGTQAKTTSEERAKIPYGLSEAVCLACEKEVKG